MGCNCTATKVVLVALGALVTIAAVAELLLRILSPLPIGSALPVSARIKAQSETRHATYQPDAELGAVMSSSQTLLVNTPEYSYTMRTDHAGFPNRDPWPDSVDVAVFGNSLIIGAGVGYDGQFTTLLQERLGGRSVLNFGIPGGGTAHQLIAYRKFAAPLKPRLVIATLWLVWEIDNSWKFADWLDENPRPDFTEYRFTYGDASPAQLGALKKAIRYGLQNSRLVRKFHEWFRSARGIREPIEQVPLDGGELLLLSTRSVERLESGWNRTGFGDFREPFFAPLEELKSAVEADGGRLLVLLFPSKEELYLAMEHPAILDVVQSARIELAARRIELLDLYPVFERTASGPPAFFRVDMHPNNLGHRMVADALAAWIASQEIFTQPDT